MFYPVLDMCMCPWAKKSMKLYFCSLYAGVAVNGELLATVSKCDTLSAKAELNEVTSCRSTWIYLKSKHHMHLTSFSKANIFKHKHTFRAYKRSQLAVS